MKPFFVYLLKCSDGSYYAGHTDDIDKRLFEHNNDLFGTAAYTSSRKRLMLVYHEPFGTRDEALTAEMKIKKWNRKKKEALITGDWDLLRDLSKRKR